MKIHKVIELYFQKIVHIFCYLKTENFVLSPLIFTFQKDNSRFNKPHSLINLY